MNIQTSIIDSKATLSLSGWLDTQTAPELKAELDALPADIGALVIDCRELEYISSAGLRQLVAAHTKMNGNLEITNVSSEILPVLKMTGLTNVLHIK